LINLCQESGITPTTIARRRATQTRPVAGPSNEEPDNAAEGDDGAEPAEAGATPERPTRRRTRASNVRIYKPIFFFSNQLVIQAAGYASDELDEPEGESPTTKKRKLTKAAEAKLKAKEKEKAKKKAKKDDDDDDYDDEDEDAYTALSKSMWTNAASSPSKPPVGSFENCVKCEKQFTVVRVFHVLQISMPDWLRVLQTRYTMAANPGPGFLCHQCAKASGSDPFKKPALPKKRKVPADKRVVVNFEERRFPTLVSICIQVSTLTPFPRLYWLSIVFH